jgi:DNA-binding NtrC family response regulator
MRILKDALASLALSDVHLVLCGERGTGKREWAEAVHRKSARCEESFVVLPLAAMGDARTERRLFGDDAGRDGLLAHRGTTVYLDAIESLTPRLQRRLAQWTTTAQPSTVRLIAGTGVMLEEQVTLGRFDRDLYRRLAAVQLCIPPLRERRDDVPAIVEHWLWHGAECDASAADLRSDALVELASYHWPGNVRELIQVVEAARNAAAGRPITADLVRHVLARHPRRAVAADIVPLDQIEREYIHAAVARCDGNQSLAARRLGIGRSTLIRKLRSARARSDRAA